MGYDCGATVAGESLAELLKSVQTHAIDHHDYTREEVDSLDNIAIWEGAIKQSARPGSIRTTRTDLDRENDPD